MVAAKIVDMTVDELKSLIVQVVDERLPNFWQKSKDTRSIEEVLASMDRWRWTPPPGSPTTTKLLREDRDGETRASDER